jgi:hypothetical protein
MIRSSSDELRRPESRRRHKQKFRPDICRRGKNDRQAGIASGVYSWIDQHDEPVPGAIQAAINCWLTENGSALVTAIAQRVADAAYHSTPKGR